MASDNGKAGEIDWYDVWAVAEYIERKYDGSVEINISSAAPITGPRVLLCASFVGNDPVRPRGAAGSHEIPFAPGTMRKVPQLAYELLLEMQEEIDDLRPGYIAVMMPKV